MKRSTYYKVVPAFGEEKGKGFVILLFNGTNNMAQGTVDGVFWRAGDAHRAAKNRGLKRFKDEPAYYTDDEGFEVWSG
jgi:hypothetical protein